MRLGCKDLGNMAPDSSLEEISTTEDWRAKELHALLNVPNVSDFWQELGESLVTRRPIELALLEVEVETKAWSFAK